MNSQPSTPTTAKKGRLRKARKLAVLATKGQWRRALRHGVAAAVEHRRVPFTDDYKTVIDIGAHHGQFTLLARDRFPSASIYCVEPMSDAIARLHAVFSDDEAVFVLPYAAADTRSESPMHISRKSDSSSLLPILDEYVEAFPGTELDRVETVNTRPLDDIIPREIVRPCLLKIDAQGGEAAVLKGATRVLQDVDAAFVECSFVEFYDGQPLADDVIDVMRSNDLRLTGVFSVVQDAGGRCLQADMLFSRTQ